jgi:hypothetical protein
VASPAVDALLVSAFRLTAAGSPSLVLSPCALPAGGEYALTLMAIDSNGGVAFARLFVRPNAPPHGGALTLVGGAFSPLLAVEGLLGAQLEMVGWTTVDVDDLPLRYALALRALGDTVYAAVGERSPSARLASPPLPPGSEWEALGEAVGQWGASSSSSLALAVVPTDGGAAGFVRATLSGGGAFALAAFGGDVVGASAIAGVLARALVLAGALDDSSSSADGGALAPSNSSELAPPLSSCADARSAEAAERCAQREEVIGRVLAVVEAAVVTEPPSERTALAAGHALVALASQPTELTDDAVVAIARAVRVLATATATLARVDGSAAAPVWLLLEAVSVVLAMAEAERAAAAVDAGQSRRRLSDHSAEALVVAVEAIDPIASGALIGAYGGMRGVVQASNIALATALAGNGDGGACDGDCELLLLSLAPVGAGATLVARARLGTDPISAARAGRRDGGCRGRPLALPAVGAPRRRSRGRRTPAPHRGWWLDGLPCAHVNCTSGGRGAHRRAR